MIKTHYYPLYAIVNGPKIISGSQSKAPLAEYVDTCSSIHYICDWNTKSIYLSKFQTHMATDIEVKRLNVCSHASFMVIGIGMR